MLGQTPAVRGGGGGGTSAAVAAGGVRLVYFEETQTGPLKLFGSGRTARFDWDRV